MCASCDQIRPERGGKLIQVFPCALTTVLSGKYREEARRQNLHPCKVLEFVEEPACRWYVK